MGTPQAAVPSLERLLDDGHELVAVYTQPDGPAGRGKKLTASPVKQKAMGRGAEHRDPLNIKTEETFDEFRSLGAVAAVVVAYGRILPERWLSAFPEGAINVHFSLLPKYRGAAPVNWAIANGEIETGVTTMKMDAGLDTGDVLLQRSTPIASDETSVELMSGLSILGADLLSETLARLDSIEPRPQDDSVATFAPILKREDGRIDWSMNSRAVADRVRGFQPFPSAWTTLGGKHLTIWSALSMENGGGAPGEVTAARADRFEVECGGGTSLKIVELQPEGKRRMSTRDFLNGAKVEAGTILR